MIYSIPKFDESNFVEWTRPFNDILQISCPFLSKIVSVFEKSEPILFEKSEPFLRSRESKNPIESSDNDTGYTDELKPSNVDDIKAWDSTNAHLISVLRFTTIDAARSGLLQFEPKNGRPGGVVQRLGGEGLSPFCPRFGRGRHENSPSRGLISQTPW